MDVRRGRLFWSPVTAALLLLILLPGCATVEPGPAPAGATTAQAPTPKVGNYWEYAVRDGYTGLPRGTYRYTVSRVDPDRVVLDLTRDGERVDSYIYAPGWNGIEHPLRNLQRFRYSPPYPAYAFPLYTGERWRSIVNSTDVQTGRSYKTHVHADVGAWRRMKVPAGEFEAVEVRRTVYAGNAESFKLQEEIAEADWYAPAVGFPIMSAGKSSHIDPTRTIRGVALRIYGDWLIAELVSYSVQ
jgi:hypothetical protein